MLFANLINNHLCLANGTLRIREERLPPIQIWTARFTRTHLLSLPSPPSDPSFLHLEESNSPRFIFDPSPFFKCPTPHLTFLPPNFESHTINLFQFWIILHHTNIKLFMHSIFYISWVIALVLHVVMYIGECLCPFCLPCILYNKPSLLLSPYYIVPLLKINLNLTQFYKSLSSLLM